MAQSTRDGFTSTFGVLVATLARMFHKIGRIMFNPLI